MRWLPLLLVLMGCVSEVGAESNFDGCFQPGNAQQKSTSAQICFRGFNGLWKQEHRQSDFDLGYWKRVVAPEEFLVNHSELKAFCIIPDGIAPYRFCRVVAGIEITTVGNFSGNRTKSKSGYVMVRSAIHYSDRYVVEEYSKLN